MKWRSKIKVAFFLIHLKEFYWFLSFSSNGISCRRWICKRVWSLTETSWNSWRSKRHPQRRHAKTDFPGNLSLVSNTANCLYGVEIPHDFCVGAVEEWVNRLVFYKGNVFYETWSSVYTRICGCEEHWVVSIYRGGRPGSYSNPTEEVVVQRLIHNEWVSALHRLFSRSIK